MNIGVLGIGLMGKPLAERLLQANYSVIVNNRTISKAQELKPLGGELPTLV